MSMTIIEIKQTGEKIHVEKSGPQIAASFKVQFTGTYSTTYIYQNATALGLPDYGDYLASTSSEMFVSNTSADITPNSLYVGTTAQPGVFTYDATFSTIDAQRLDLSPIYRPAVVTGGGIELTEVRRVDQQGNAIVNSAGDYYEGLPEFYVPGSEITISWNVASNPAANAQIYSFSTNESAIWGQDAYSGVMGKITYSSEYEVYQGILIEYYRITVPIRFRNDGLSWNFQPFDYGYRYEKSGTLQNYVDPKTGICQPVFLDGDAGLLNGNGSTVGGDDPVIFPASSGDTPAGYETLVPQSWSGLSIPLNPFM
jgi:hypothetical protein